MSFSGVLQLTDLNDFITPSLGCVKPGQVKKSDSNTGALKISVSGDDAESNKNRTQLKSEKVTITLTDCLACSGCITSAESVLITQQSQDELYKILDENKILTDSGKQEDVKIVIVSISPQARASIAVKYGLSIIDTMAKLTQFFHTLGVDFVFDTMLCEAVSLLECQKEFVSRFKEKGSPKGIVPVLTSACPGWVCYAEKTHGSYILPYISTVKSAQQIMGSLVKNYLSSKLQKTPSKIYHVTVMPCFDKKLEASRSDFYNDTFETRDVDCVITSIEVEAMLEKAGVFLPEVKEKELDKIFEELPNDQFYVHSGSTSGGYCEQIFLHAAKELFSEDYPELQYKILRNADFKELTLVKDSVPVLKFAIANGFRNIQNIVQKLKRGKSPYDFVEIMACPAGCANGGAQIRTNESSSSEILKKVEELYYSVPNKSAEHSAAVKHLYEMWLEGEESMKAKQMLHTSYHEVEKMNNPLTIKW